MRLTLLCAALLFAGCRHNSEQPKVERARLECRERYDRVQRWLAGPAAGPAPRPMEPNVPFEKQVAEFRRFLGADPWGSRYVIRPIATDSPDLADRLVVFSLGPDRKGGTGDDISYPREGLAHALSKARRECRLLYRKAAGWILLNTTEDIWPTDEESRRFLEENKLTVDPWGQPYTYRRAVAVQNRSYPFLSRLCVHSAGPDRTTGSADDISVPFRGLDPQGFADAPPLRSDASKTSER